MSFRPQQAFVLAAGLGTRMRPASDLLPKPLVQLARKPLIDHVLDRIADAGVPEVVVNVHYKADQIEAHLKARTRPAIRISDERGMLLETGGGVKKALPLLGPDPFLTHNSDSVWIEGVGSNLERLFAAYDPDKMDFLLMMALGSASIGYSGTGDFSLDSEGRIRRRREGEVVPFVFTGVQIVHPRSFADAPDGAFSMNAMWNRAMLTGRAFGVRMEGLWLHVGSPQELAVAERVLAGHRVPKH